jgi:hypothetical protein
MSAYGNYLAACVRAVCDHPDWRVGQAHFNVLADLAPDVADAVRGTNLDPFYDDARLDAFLRHVQTQLAPTTNGESPFPFSHLP